ncbi:MAG: tetratricopeptide repeat protein [Elusimicrobia bacterium]|nr:tetratricopeptide repeat protein [Elusimicrobiota bacterium]
MFNSLRRFAILVPALFFAAHGARAVHALVEASEVELLRQQNLLKEQLEGKIQVGILDPILGRDRAKAFVDVELEYTASRKENVKTGAGMAERYKEKSGAKGSGFQTNFILPGIPKPKNITSSNQPPDKPEASIGRTAAQQQQEQEQVFALRSEVKRLRVTVIHDDTVARASLEMIRARIVDALTQFKASPDQVVFRPARFNAHPWTDDFKRPDVYIPLLFAALLLLLLTFLFGPLARFLRRYVDALREKPAAEVNVESKIESPDEEGGLGGGPEESKLDIMLGRKPSEPPPPSEEDEAMKKLEPFSYINEDNLKRLGNLFLLRHEEPWLIAVVLSYLKPEYAKQVLSTLPVGLQAKVAMEALKVRQVTREQVMAIDAEVKENVDFVVGGMEHLLRLLEESDAQTRQNILEYLKNEKPATYERVRKFILNFEDVVRFQDRDMQTVIRALTTEGMARALQSAAPDVIDKFLNNMSAGAGSLLKESMEYSKGLTPAQIEEERSKIVDLIKQLEKEGKITVREAMREGGFEGFQEELAIDREERYGGPSAAPGGQYAPGTAGKEVHPLPAAPADPAAAQQYFNAGIELYQGGSFADCVAYFQQAAQLDGGLWQAHQYLGAALQQSGRTAEAVAHYEKALEHNPDPQLKAWVDSFKAQVR